MNTYYLHKLAHHLASRQRAHTLREDVLEAITRTQQKVRIDLSEVMSVSDSFADEFFGVLAQTYGDKWFQEYIDVTGASDVVRNSIVRAIHTKLRTRFTTSKSARIRPRTASCAINLI
ncbi:MAG: STAS-like domain-containing protein [Deltaproteobacteria bacterium]|nr:STAS-like domain-containing protein [Deltaproteobacteria bacterium]